MGFETPAVAGHREAEGEIDQRDEDIDLDAERLPGRIDDRGLGGGQEIEDADDEDQAGILEECDERIHQRRNDVPDRLRQDDQAVLLPVRQAERVGGVVLPSGHGLQAAANNFREISAGEQDEGDLRAQQLVDVDAVRHEQRKHHARHEQQADQRDAADQLDIKYRQRVDRRKFRTPAERHQNPEG